MSFELELELIQTQMAQKPMPREEVIKACHKLEVRKPKSEVNISRGAIYELKRNMALL
jgi:hypothetical protein